MKSVKFDACKMQNMNSGLGQFCLHLANALYPIKKSYSFTAIVPEGVNEKCFFDVLPLSWFQRYFKPIHADVIHLTHQESGLIPNASCKTILTIHDLNFLHKKMPGWKRKLRKIKLQRKIHRASALVFISEYVKNECIQVLDTGNKPLHVIYNGVPMMNDKAEKPLWIKECSFLFTLGIFQKRKNFSVLIPMMRELPELMLVVAGQHDSKYLPYLKELALKEGVADRVIFPGPVSEGQKRWLYENCLAFVFPSLAEGFGLPVVEAMSYGKPVLSSPHTSLPEIGGQIAYYYHDFSPHAMSVVTRKAIDEHSELRAEQSRKHAARFTWEEAAKAYHALYCKILEE